MQVLRTSPAPALKAFLLGALMVGIVVLITNQFCQAQKDDANLHVHQDGVTPGYILVAPYRAQDNYDGPGEVLLLDTGGHVVHAWQTQYPVFHALLNADGNLVVALTPPLAAGVYPSQGTTGLLEELDWNGGVIWKYEDVAMTHDFDILPDGSIAYTRWNQAPAPFAASVRGGLPTATTSVWTNELVVINKNGEKLWTWRVADHLDAWRYVLSPLVPKADWAHINSIQYVPENPISGTEAFLVSFRDISEVMLIDKKNGTILWQSPQGMFSLQHDATLLPDGNILAFDNGLFRQGPPALLSAVREINPRSNTSVWSYTGGRSLSDAVMFASSVMGGAERLPNGNTLITVSATGRILEVAPDGTLLWEYDNVFRDEDGASRLVFKARKYDPSGTEWASRVHTPFPPARALCSL